MKRVYWILAGVLLLAAGVLWFLRSQSVVWSVSEPGLKPLLEGVKSPGDSLAPGGLPWESPDLRLGWIDPWSASGPLVLTPGPQAALAAYEVLGLQTAAAVPRPTDWASWTADLDRTKGVVPLAVAGQSDAELLTLLVWIVEISRGPEELEKSFELLTKNPESGLSASGNLTKDHPWYATVETLRQWTAQGRLAKNWWDYSDEAVARAVDEGRARYGLTWSGLHFPLTKDGVQTHSFTVVPPAPGRLNFSLVGRWLTLERQPGWGSDGAVNQRRQALESVSTGQNWLKERGLLLADAELPAVNQESKAVTFAQFAAAFWVAAPAPGSDLKRWAPLLNAVRANLRTK